MMSAVVAPLEPASLPISDDPLDSILDERDKFTRIIPLVQVKSDQQNNFDDIFPMILADKSALKENRITQHDLYKLDSFGAALAW